MMKRFAFSALAILLLSLLAGCGTLILPPPTDTPSPFTPEASLPPAVEEATPSLAPTETALPTGEEAPTEIPEAPTITAPAGSIEELPTGTPLPATLTPAISATPKPHASTQVWTFNEADRTVVKLDPNSMTLATRVQLTGKPLGISIGEGAIWALEEVNESTSNVVRIDPAINQVIMRIPILNGAAMSITAGAGSVWVGIAEPVDVKSMPKGIDYSQPGGVVRIDPRSNTVIQYIKTNAVAADLELYEGNLWVLEWVYMHTYLDRINLDTLEIVSIPTESKSAEYVHNFGRIAMNSSGIWAIPNDSTAPFIYHVDPADGKVSAPIELGKDIADLPVDIAAREDGVWVAMRSGKLGRVDPASRQLSAVFTVGNELTRLASIEQDIWAVSRDNATAYRVDPASSGGAQIPGAGTGSRPKPTATITPTPANIATAIGGGSTSCDKVYPTRLKKGGRAAVSLDPPLPNNVRSSPTRKENNIVGVIQPGEQVELVDGPVCAENWVWWQIRSFSTGLKGWTSEGASADEYWLVPVQ